MLVAAILTAFLASLATWPFGRRILLEHWYAVVAITGGLWLGALSKFFMARFITFAGDDTIYALVGALVFGAAVESGLGQRTRGGD